MTTDDACYEIPASWVEQYQEPSYDEFLEFMIEADQQYADEKETDEILRGMYNKGLI